MIAIYTKIQKPLVIQTRGFPFISLF